MSIIRAMSHPKRNWALVLGASSGFGEAASIALAKSGRNVFGVHLDRRATLPNVERIASEIEDAGGRASFFNVNAADAAKRAEVIAAMRETIAADAEQPAVDVVLHSLAFGTLKPFLGDEKERMTQAQMDMTLNVMAHSLVYWTQDLVARGMVGRGSRIFSMTSEGSHRVVPNYGAVGAAKAALEAHTRQLAMELGPRGVLVNCIQAGVTDTPALRKIPGNEIMIETTLRRNPGGRMTRPEDVAATIAALSQPAVQFVSGSVIFVDGGEDVVG